ncbi:MAG: polyprenol monophosphomannose synthase [Myxococcota bacterium]|nr:polyprenol monophosphomannose synthase [Myxococcota bacterium]
MSPTTGVGALVIVPTYNEKENISQIVPAILDAVPDANILIVDDHSPDGTGVIADQLAADDDRIYVVHRDGPRGLGRAYLHGFRWALARDYQFIFEMDADFSHQPRYLPDFLAAAADADLVLGCRYMEGGGIEGWGLHRLILSRGGNRYARTVLGLPQRDLTGGFKCFRRAVLETMPLDDIRSVGYCFQIELTWRAIRSGFRIGEVPIVFPDRTAGVSKMSMAIAWEGVVGVWKMRLGFTGR